MIKIKYINYNYLIYAKNIIYNFNFYDIYVIYAD